MHIDMGNNDIYIFSRGGELNRFQDIMINYKIQKFPFQFFLAEFMQNSKISECATTPVTLFSSKRFSNQMY